MECKTFFYEGMISGNSTRLLAGKELNSVDMDMSPGGNEVFGLSFSMFTTEVYTIDFH